MKNSYKFLLTFVCAVLLLFLQHGSNAQCLLMTYDTDGEQIVTPISCDFPINFVGDVEAFRLAQNSGSATSSMGSNGEPMELHSFNEQTSPATLPEKPTEKDLWKRNDPEGFMLITGLMNSGTYFVIVIHEATFEKMAQGRKDEVLLYPDRIMVLP